jgi:hypothetical protein
MIFGQRVNPLERLEVARAVPVRQKFVTTQFRPFLDEPHRTRRKLAAEHRPVNRDRGAVPALFGMKMRGRVIALPPVHGDCDPIEDADRGTNQ